MAPMVVKILLSVLLVAVVAEERQGRQLNWDSDLDAPPSYHSADPYLASASSVLSAQQSKANYDSPDQDISRDSYSPSSNYNAGYDYGYEAAPSDTASYTGNSASNYGYKYRPFTVPTTSRPFYSYNYGNQGRQQEDKVSSLSGLQSGKIAYFPLPTRLNYSQLATSRGGVGTVDDVNRALYDDDSPLGGVGSRPTTSTSLLGSTTLRNVESRQDDFGYGGGMYSVPPAGAYGAGGYGGYGASGYGGYGAGGYGGYGAGGYGGYGTGGYGGYGAGGYGGYGAGGYGGYGAGGYGAGGYGGYANSYKNGYGYSYAYGMPSSGGSANYGLGGYGGYGGMYRSPLYAGHSNYGGYGGDGYGYGMSGWGVSKPYHFLKKLKKAYKHLYKYGFPINGGFGGYGGYAGGYGGGYGGHGAGYGGYGAVAPYGGGWFEDVPTVWDLGKFVFKSVAKSVVKPIYSIISPFCGPLFYKRSDGLVDDKQNSFISALTAFLPIGLFLAAIVPNIVSVSAGRRKRSDGEEIDMAKEEATFPILDMISEYGARSLQEPKCQSKIVCEMGRMGGKPEANMLQRALWLTANYVPETLARMAGTDKLFRSIRSQQCSEFKCSTD